MNVIIYILIGVLIFFAGYTICYLYFRPNRLEILEKNEEIARNNKSLEERCKQLNLERETIDREVSSLQAQKQALTDSIEENKKYADKIYEEKINLVNERFDRASESLCKKYQDAEKQYQKEYLETMSNMAKEALLEVNSQRKRLQEVEEKLKNAQSKQSAVVALLKREEEKKDNIRFYKLQLSDLDLKEIAKLREVSAYLRNDEPLNKVIWKSYYEKPFTDLTGRIIGSKVICGIYKITNLENQKVYIGQSVDIKSRLRSHIKRGLGAETPTRNKLYSVMKEVGVENFSYEIIEECPREQLNDRECYWISYFQSQDYGYNETRGGA